MNILKKISNNYRIETSKLASNDKEIKNLIELSEIEIPEDF